jgi:hypothetical protein
MFEDSHMRGPDAETGAISQKHEKQSPLGRKDFPCAG